MQIKLKIITETIYSFSFDPLLIPSGITFPVALYPDGHSKRRIPALVFTLYVEFDVQISLSITTCLLLSNYFQSGLLDSCIRMENFFAPLTVIVLKSESFKNF